MKQCPTCKKAYPDTESFCAIDGSRLYLLSKISRTTKKTAVSLIIAFAILGFIIVNALPYVLKWAASNFEVSLVGISYEKNVDPVDLARQTREILEDFVGAITGGKSKLAERKNQNFTLVFELKNDNIVPVGINLLKFELYINSRQVGNGELLPDESIFIHPFEKKEFRCPLTIYPMRLITSAGKIVAAGRLRYRIRGKAVVTVLYGKIKCPFDVKGISIQL